MRAFVVSLENHPGSLAGLAETIAGRGINITGISGSSYGSSAAVGLMTDNDNATRSALDGGGFEYAEADVVTAALDHRPGTLADATRRLATAGVNVTLVAVIGMEENQLTVGFGVDNAETARTALAELAASG
jgi:hypothetical protein